MTFARAIASVTSKKTKHLHSNPAGFAQKNIKKVTQQRQIIDQTGCTDFLSEITSVRDRYGLHNSSDFFKKIYTLYDSWPFIHINPLSRAQAGVIRRRRSRGSRLASGHLAGAPDRGSWGCGEN